MKPRIRTTFALVLLALPAPALAAEYCVSCSGPDTSYRCEVGGSTSDSRGWLLCITELAKQGGHDSCSVDRNIPAPCPGLHKVLALPEGGQPPASFPVQAAVPVPPPAPPQASPPEAAPPDGTEPAPKRVPQTMQELAGDTFEASKVGLKKAGESVSNTAKKAGDAVTDTAKAAGDGLSKAGDAVGGAAKKTWDCLTSLFQSC